MKHDQHVCLVCGYNMVGDCPDHCPFCGADRSQFLTAEEASARYRVVETPITDSVSRLNSEPALGLEHAAYRVDTGQRVFLIDCPCVFDARSRPVDVIAFTHPHFLGACNLYRRHHGAEVWIHAADAENPLARSFEFDRRFERDFEEAGLEALHLGGHTPGFTVYFHRGTLFVCDLVFLEDGRASFNPYGPGQATREAGARLWAALADRELSRVCGWNYVADFREWRDRCRRLLQSTQPL